MGVSLTGTITGATWLGERTISFDFDESGSTASEGDTDPIPDPSPTGAGSLPAVGETYQGCYVLSVTDTGADVDILLLSPDETTCLGTDNAVQTALGNCGTADIDDWAVPTKQQMQLVEARLLSTDATLAGTNYLFRRTNSALGFRTLGDDEDAWPTASTTATYRLRPVAIVTIPKE